MLVELREQRPPRGVRERRESAIERLVLILNHTVKYREVHPSVKPFVEIARKFLSDDGMFYQRPSVVCPQPTAGIVPCHPAHPKLALEEKL